MKALDCYAFLAFLPGLLAFAFLLSAIAIACFWLVTTGPPLPECRSPAFQSCIVLLTTFWPLFWRLDAFPVLLPVLVMVTRDVA